MGAYIVSGLGRVLLSLIFIILGATAIFNWEATETDFSTLFANWELYTGNMEEAGNLFPFLISSVKVWVIVSIVLQILGGAFVFLGIKVRWGAFLLLLYLIPTTILNHHFWFLEGQAMNRSLVLFLKNLSIIGGLFILLGLGKGIKKNKVKRDKTLDRGK